MDGSSYYYLRVILRERRDRVDQSGVAGVTQKRHGASGCWITLPERLRASEGPPGIAVRKEGFDESV